PHVGDANLGALVREEDRRFASDATGRARDDRDLALEPPHHPSVEMNTFLTSEWPSIACMPSSRPKPDCFVPPNGVVTRTELFELIERTPVSIARAMRSARAESRVHTGPDRPYA